MMHLPTVQRRILFFIVVYYEDFVTIYDYTDIKVTDLPIELQREIYVGMQVKDLEELYEFLEDHTS